MLEAVFGGGQRQVAWNGAIPAADANTLLRMHTFASVADIKDKSANAIAITNNGSVTVGSDGYGTYMLFNGSNWLEFKSTVLDKLAVEITMIIGGLAYLANANGYGQPLLDCRPNMTNGNYWTWGYNSFAQPPFSIVVNYPSTSYTYSTKTILKDPVVLKLVIKNRQCQMWSGGVMIGQHNVSVNGVSGDFINQSCKIGRSAYASAGVPNLRGRVYYFEIKNIP